MKLSGKLTAVVLLVAALVLLNFIASFLHVRFDLTADRVYTLSPGTRSLLSKIEEPIAMEFYFSRNVRDLPPQIKSYGTRVEEMLREYVAASDGRITLRIIDPEPDTDEETAARRLGLEPQALPTGEPVYFGLAVTLADQEKAIPFFAPAREPYLEFDVSQILYSIQQFNKPKLGLISGLPLQGTPAMMPGQRPQPDQFSVQDWSQRFDIVPIEETATELPADLSLLAVIHPGELSDKLQFAIDQYVLSGKPAFIAVDPSSYSMKLRQPRQQMMMGPQPGTSSNLPRLFANWGIEFDTNFVVGDVRLATQVRDPAGGGLVEYPIWMELHADQFSAESPATSGVNTMLLVEAGPISVADDRGYEVTPLIRTTDSAGTVQTMTLQFTQPGDIAKQIVSAGAAQNVAVLVRGRFKSAYPEGAPKDPPAADEAAEGETPAPAPETPAEPALKESTTTSTLVVVGDADWLMDNFSVRSLGLLGLYSPMNDNYVFAGSVMDFLGGSQDLVSIRGKATVLRPFTVIRDMERAAQTRKQAQLEVLEKRLADVQKELNALVSGQGEGNKLVLTPEIQDKIADFRAQEAQMRKERRDIQRELREDIETLKSLLTFINLFSVPALVAAFGISYFIRRSNRQRAAA